MTVLRTNVPIESQHYRHHGRFTVRAGETATFVLGYGPSYGKVPEPIDPFAALAATQQSWDDRAAEYQKSGAYVGQGSDEYSDAVMRSLITLKALT